MRSKDPSMLRIVDLWTFRSDKSNKRYIVEVEYFSHNFLGIKFYWKGVEHSKERYSLLTNDYEPRTIVMSCVHVMLEYFKRDNSSSFGFVAAADLGGNPADKPNKRFRFYRAMMLNIFGKQTFIQGYDVENSLYLLVSRMSLESGKISMRMIENEISRLYEGDYSLLLEL